MTAEWEIQHAAKKAAQKAAKEAFVQGESYHLISLVCKKLSNQENQQVAAGDFCGGEKAAFGFGHGGPPFIV